MFKKSTENKVKLEHKLYLARENPEPVFDLSECGLKNVPNGIYSLCKVFLKNVLRLEHNYLNSLASGGSLKDLCFLKVLDIHDNAFSTLPDEIYFLNNLEELYLNENNLKLLPNSLCKLSRLKILNVSNNNLQSLPQDLGDLINLTHFNISNNKHLNYLPKSLCRAKLLTHIQADNNNFLYPPTDVVQKGINFILKYICDDTGVVYEAPVDMQESIEDCSTNKKEPFYCADVNMQDKIWQLQNIKKQKLQEFLEIEKNNELIQRQETELASVIRVNKEKLLADITKQQNKFDLELAKVQQRKDIEKFQLIEQLQQAELKADTAIKELLMINREPTVQLLEKENREEEKMLAACTRYKETLRKTDILLDMQNLLEQETEIFKKIEASRTETINSVLQYEIQSDARLLKILNDQNINKAELSITLQQDDELQKAVVGILLERADARSWGLLQQVKYVEAQLAALTAFEIDRRKVDVAKYMNDLTYKRANLSVLLVDLLDQQNERRKQLISTLQILEDNNDTSEDFWLKQYQRLLDCVPNGLSETQKNMDINLIQTLLVSGVIHCLPFLARLTQNQCDIQYLTDDVLKEAGIKNKDDRSNILRAFHLYKQDENVYINKPTAPSSAAVEEASAPPVQDTTNFESECVICMDLKCQIIFVPCGHLCCCSTCSNSVVNCPLCRATVERKIQVIMT